MSDINFSALKWIWLSRVYDLAGIFFRFAFPIKFLFMFGFVQVLFDQKCIFVMLSNTFWTDLFMSCRTTKKWIWIWSDVLNKDILTVPLSSHLFQAPNNQVRYRITSQTGNQDLFIVNDVTGAVYLRSNVLGNGINQYNVRLLYFNSVIFTCSNLPFGKTSIVLLCSKLWQYNKNKYHNE